MRTVSYTETDGNNTATLVYPDENTITLSDSKNIVIHGTQEMIADMFKRFTAYYATIENPETTKIIEHIKAPYAPLDSVLNTIRYPLGSSGLAIMQTATDNDKGEPTVKSLLICENGAYISFPDLSYKPQKDGIQAFVATITYLKRTLINAIAGITGEVDDDGQSLAHEEDKKKPAPKPKKTNPQPKHQKELVDLCKTKSTEFGRDVVIDILKNYGKKDGNPTYITDIEETKAIIKKLNELKSEV